MQLTQAQLAEFDREGFLFFPGQFTPDEARALQAASQRVYDMHREEVWRESNGAARTAFAAHKYDETMAALGAHPRLVNPVMQLVDGPVYMHQFKVNAKAAFDGDVWQWHQDYGTWRRDDEMPEPRAMKRCLAYAIDARACTAIDSTRAAPSHSPCSRKKAMRRPCTRGISA